MRALIPLCLLTLVLTACAGGESTTVAASQSPTGAETAQADAVPGEPPAVTDSESTTPGATEIATFGAGCYWCVEAVLEQLDGVSDVTSGFMGGQVENPSYEAVCSGTTGHAEVVQVTFDPAVISYDELLSWFWRLHDPTTLNRQGADVGTQYRSVIFYHSEAQRVAAETSKAAADASGAFADPIVTEITEASTYYEAKGEHQDFYKRNKDYGYCRVVIAPKLDKLGLEQ